MPGEPVRITRCLDVLQPRCRLDGPTFPGWDAGPAPAPRDTAPAAARREPYPDAAQSQPRPDAARRAPEPPAARWEVVDGMAVIVSGQRRNTQQAVIDLFGPGAAATPFGGHVGLVLVARAPAELPDDAFDRRLRLAGLRYAAWMDGPEVTGNPLWWRCSGSPTCTGGARGGSSHTFGEPAP